MMVVGPTGSLGVGTTSPSDKLHIDTSGQDQGILITGSGSNYAQLKRADSGGAQLTLFQSGTAKFNFDSRAGANSYINGSNLGLNTTGPGSTLGVNGNVSVGTYAGTAAPTSGMIVSGNVGIGTSTVNNKLEVAGTAAVNASTEGASAYTNTGTAYTIPDAAFNIRRLTLNGNATVTLPTYTSTAKVWTVTVMVKQDSTGGRTLAFAAPSGDTILWDSGASMPAHQTTLNKTTIYQFTKPGDETTWYASMVWKQN